MRWYRSALLLAVAGCGGQPACPLVGCVSQLTVRLPAGVVAGTACVEGVCTSAVVDGSLVVPLGRRAEGDMVSVTVTLPGASPAAGQPYTGVVPVVRTRPNGASCPPVCVNGTAVVDTAAGRVVGAPG